MLFDRIQLLYNIKNEPNEEEIHKKLKENGEFTGNVDSFRSYFHIKNGNFNIKYFYVKKYLILDFNVQKFFYNTNFGEIKEKNVLIVINYLNKYLKDIFSLNVDIRDFKAKSVELKKDIKCKNAEEKQMLINVYKKYDRGHFKGEEEYKTSAFKHNKSNKLCIYDKKSELIAHNNYNKLTYEEKKAVENVVRIEVQLSQKKLCKMMKRDIVLFSNILCLETQEKLFSDFYKNLNFEALILSKTGLINKIKDLGFSNKKTKNLIFFVEALNRFDFKKVKEMFSSAYKYLKIFKDNGVSAYYVDDNEYFMAIINSKKIDNKTMNFKYVDTSEYNIYILTGNDKNNKINIRT